MKHLLKYMGLALVLFIIMIFFINFKLFSGTQKKIQNNFYDFKSASDKILIVAIDEKSISDNNLGSLETWSRENYAKAIEILNKNGASTIGLDVLLINEKDGDLKLKKVLEENKNVVLAANYIFKNNNFTAELPNKTLLSAKPLLAWVNVNMDKDGFVRKIPIYADVDNYNMLSFSLVIARNFLNIDNIYNIFQDKLQLSDKITIPIFDLLDKENHKKSKMMYVNYFAESNSYQRISFSDLLDKNFVDTKKNPVNFKNKIVLIGPTALSLQDYYLSPVSNGIQMPGVEIHANNIQSIIENKFLVDQSVYNIYLLLIIIIFLNTFLFSKLKVRFAVLILILEAFSALIYGIFIYDYGILFNIIYPLIAIILSFISTFIMRFLLEEKDKKFIKSAFSHYVNKNIVDQIIKNPKNLELGGRKVEVTAFFSDIASFTSISENIPADRLVDLLNKYLTEMTDIILRNNGTLDKYEGDAIMAFWGAPIESQNHAVDACKTALENQKKLVLFRNECIKNNLPEIYIRIGINSGEVIAGNMGSEERFDYTIMGDNVNLASRLEGINKEYNTDIIVSEATYLLAKDYFVFKELDNVKVKGKEKSIKIYELIDYKGHISNNKKLEIDKFHKALELYRNQNFKDALNLFEQLQKDRSAKIFILRCRHFIKNPPNKDWDAIWVFNVK